MTRYMKSAIGLLMGITLAGANILPGALFLGLPGIAYAQTAGAAIGVPEVPFYSQFSDIGSAKWQKVGCGIASLAMLIDFYQPGMVTVDALLKQGIAAGAFNVVSGWSHQGLVSLAARYDLQGTTYDFSGSSAGVAFSQFAKAVNAGPVIASVHYKFDPKNPIPHLVVISGISDGRVYYNDPAAKSGGKDISVKDFMKAWKKRFITVGA